MRTLRAGFTDYLFKPVDPSRLVALVNSYLARTSGAVTQATQATHITLIDDDALQGKLNALQLRERGFVVELFTDPFAALAAVRAGPPDAIVVDLLMPGMTGMEFCLAVRRDPLVRHVPVVLTSSTFAIIDDDDLRLARDVGADAFLPRTPALTEVIDGVFAALGRKERNQPTAEADAIRAAFVSRLIKQLEHQSAVNASLVRQGAMHTALLSIMAGAAEILTRERDLSTVLHDVLGRALDAGGVSAGAIYLMTDREVPVLSAQRGFPEASITEVAEFFGDPELLHELALGDRAVEVPSDAVDPVRSAALLDRAGTTAVVVAPLLTAGRSHGALMLRASSQELGEGFLASVASVAAQLGQAVALSDTAERLRLSEARYRSLFEGVPTGIFRSAPDGKIMDFNREMLRLAGGTDRDELIGMQAPERYVDLADRSAWQAIIARDGEVRDFEFQLRGFDHSVNWVSLNARAILGLDGALLYYEGTITDIGKRKAAETELSAARSRLQQVHAASDVIIYSLRYAGDRVEPEWVSENMARITGHVGADVMHFEWWYENVHPEDRDRALAATKALATTGQLTQEYRFRRADGGYIWLRDSQRLLRDEQGHPAGVVGALVDITESKSLEEQLIQAQKMEAIGQLAAGVAHDFNNLLTVISGFGEMLAEDLGAIDPRRSHVDEILLAAKRAVALTRQLLAFGRRQLLQPTVFDLNLAVTGAKKMVRRLIGEHITVIGVIASEPIHVCLDPGQFEQVLLNLAVNARDAMERGGTLTIETRRVAFTLADAQAHALPNGGEYGLLQVSDTGSGMDATTVARAFEPFFTTKPRGKGTGLGLSTVYGIVKQSGGNALIYSEPGIGSTFKLYFPVTSDIESPPTNGNDEAGVRGKGEVILLAEDEDAVRQFAGAVLTRHGYVVIAAPTAAAAIDIARDEQARIDLLLTDVIMPGMTGPELSERLTELRPGLPVVYMSGYAGDAIVRHGLLSPGLNFLEKPFSAARLLTTIAETLAAAGGIA